MSSAEDTTPLTASPSANGTTSAEEFRVEPSPDAGGVSSSAEPSSGASASSAETVAPPSNQTPDEPAEGAVPEPKTKPLPKVNAVAHEVHVKVTGARPVCNAIERELFTESTTTVLVFEKGGVIRLVAAVAPGQLLFLTNEDSKREVVAQVVRKRAYKPTECYVELEFTEPAPKFWGMEFSAATALLPKDSKQVEAAELVASAETSEDDPVEVTPAPSAEQVQALKKEIEALRGQLNSLQTQTAAPPQPEPAAAPPTPAPPPPPVPEPWVATGSGKTEPDIAPNWMPAPETHLPRADFEPAAVAPVTPPVVHSSLPVEPEAFSTAMAPPAPATLPKPELDFSASLPKKRKRSFRARGNFTPGFRAGMLRLALLSTALVVTIIGAAWYKHWLPWNPGIKAKKIEVATYAGSVAQAAPPPAGTVGATGNPAGTPTGNAKPETSVVNATPQKPSAENATGNPAGESVQVVEPTKPGVVQPSGHGKAVPTASVGKRSPVHSTVPAHVEPTSVSTAESAIVPPKLLRSAKAVASLEDLRDFETGAVVIDALVDTSGMVTNMNVLSGPPSLREPAMAALREYRYVPATRNGLPIPAHVTVRIQFHFE